MLAANGVDVMIDDRSGYTPTPVVSHAILVHNRGRADGLADGIVITPSHNPPEDGGFKYNPPSGGPADTEVTGWIQDRANALLADGLSTGVFILGPEEGMALIERLDKVEAVIVTAKNEVLISSGLKGRVEILHPPTDAP